MPQDQGAKSRGDIFYRCREYPTVWKRGAGNLYLARCPLRNPRRSEFGFAVYSTFYAQMETGRELGPRLDSTMHTAPI